MNRKIPQNPKEAPIKLVWAVYTSEKRKAHELNTGEIIYEMKYNPPLGKYVGGQIKETLLKKYCKYAKYLKENEKSKLITAHLS